MPGGYGNEVRSYNNTFDGVLPVAETWKKLDYTKSDHIARQQPYIPSTESYVVKSERIIEKVHPTIIEYTRVSPVEYGVERNKWRTTVPSSVDEYERPRKVEEVITRVQTEVSQPQLLRTHRMLSPGARPDYNKHGGYTSSEYGQQESDAWSRSSSPIQAPLAEYGSQNDTWGSISRPSSQVRESEQKRTSLKPGYLGNKNLAPPGDEFAYGSISPPKDHTTGNDQWLRNSPQPSPLRSANWRQTPNSSYQTTQTGFDIYNDNKGNEMGKDMLGGYSYHYDDDTPKYSTSEKYKYIATEPSPQLTHGAWTRPSSGAWETTKITTVTRPTNDMKETVNYLAGALQQSSLKHSSPQQQYYNTLGHPKIDHFAEIIDSSEAQSSFGNMNGSTMPRESYTTTIDSREALRKYGGALV